MTDMSPETLPEAPVVTFAFSGKSKCHSQMTNMSPETQPEAPRNHICFFWKKQMPFIDDIRVQKHKERPQGVTFAFSRKKQMSLTDDR